MDDQNVFQPIQLKDLPTTVKPNILHAIDLIKEKRRGKIKARIVADG